jgi:ABC-2 type transport system permease protein
MSFDLTAWPRTFRATFGANLKGQLRFYTFSGWMLGSLLTPLFLIASAAIIAHLLTGGAVLPRFFQLTGYPDYLAFVVLGLAANGLVLSALDDGGSAVYEEESNGTWDLLALTPMNRFVWMFAKTSAGMTASLVDSVIVLAAGALVLHLRIPPGGLVVAALGLALTLVALQGLGFLMAAAGLFWKQPYALGSIFNPLLIFLSGMVFPVQALPGWLQAIANAIPLTHGLHIFRDALLLDRSLQDLAPTFGALLLTGAVFMATGFAAFSIMEDRARKQGVLGRY